MLVLYNPVDQSIVEITKDINLLHRKLNDRGQVIIFQAAKNNSSEGKGALWDSEKGLIELEDFAPLALNNCNQIVGFQISEMKNNHWAPLMWTPSEVIPLAPFIESSCFEVRWIGGINDNGYIIGQGLFDHKQHAFVLIPQ